MSTRPRFTDFIPMQKELRQTKADLAAARAEIERLTKAHDTVCGALAEAIKRAEKAEAGRDEARAQVAMAFEAAANLPSVCYDNIVDRSEIRALTPAHAKAALEAYGREMVQRASKVAVAVLINDPYSPPSLAYRVGRAILAAMEKDADQ